jgi:hypothetical protein
MLPGTDAVELRAVVRRAFQHGTMKSAAKQFSKTKLDSETWKRVLPTLSPQLRTIARTFAELQEARHRADYDVSRPLTRSEATDLVDRAEDAIETWRSIRKLPGSKAYTGEAKTFLAALLVYDQASRR